MRITICGVGYVGLTTSAMLSELGHDVVGVDIDEHKIAALNKGIIPIFEPQLDELIHKNIRAKRLAFTTDLNKAIKHGDVIFVCVGTPPKPNGEADLSYVENVARTIAEHLDRYKVIVEKSTVPVETGEKIAETIQMYNTNDVPFDVVSNPEFLREGSAVHDTFNPDRVVIGTSSEKAADIMKELYAPLKAPIVVTDIRSAEIIKHASNSFLATKISFINAIANICELTGADVNKVAEGMGYDTRIGRQFLYAGIGYGGSCLDGGEEVIINDNGSIYPIKLKVLFNKFNLMTPIKVLSFDPQSKKTIFKRILCTTKRRYKGKLVKVTSRMNKTVIATADHPFLVYEGGKFKIKLADELQNNDELPVFFDIPVSNEEIIIDMIDKIIASSAFDKSKIRVRPINTRFDKHASVVTAIKSLKTYHGRDRDILRSNCMTLNEFLSIEDNISKWITRKDVVLFTSKGNTTYCPALIEINSEFCKLLGYYISEGHITYENGLRGTRARIQFTFNIKESEYVEELCTILDTMSIRYTIFRNPPNNTISISISSRIFAFLLDQILNCGTDSYTSRVPQVVYSANNEQKLQFLSTVFKGDGHITKERNTPAVVYDYGSISRELITGMMTLFHSLSIVPSYKKSISKKSTDYAHFLRVSGRDQIKKLPNFKDASKQKEIEDRLTRYKKIIKPTGFKNINSDFATVKAKNLEISESELDVYSLEVEDTHTMVLSNGLVVHNCFPKDVSAFIKIAEKNGYNFKLLKAVEEINELQKFNFIRKVEKALWIVKGKNIGVLGLAFKPNTDDMRSAPSIEIINTLKHEGANIKAYDPKAEERAKEFIQGITYCDNPYQVAEQADALLILTEWKEFSELDLNKIKQLMRTKIIIDGRNIYDPATVRKLGFKYISVGR
ncbi:nucleotide sugar dehydrogenase [Candidatus Woesearchaeota archaeon]|nr:nucleotide sugar dehydrogenase [Candidatus Woesearchaeota archaeon]